MNHIEPTPVVLPSPTLQTSLHTTENHAPQQPSLQLSAARNDDGAPARVAARVQPAAQRNTVVNAGPVAHDLHAVPGEFHILKPDCAAKDRLLKWRPSQPANIDGALTADDAAKISLAMWEAFREGTKVTYAAGLKLYLDMCDAKGIPDRARIPASQDLITLFVAQLVGAYSASAAKNYFAGIRAWHIIHRFRWTYDAPVFTTLSHAAKAAVPDSSKKPKKQPYTVDLLEAIIAVLDLSSPRDAAVAAAATILFYSLGRSGEVVLKDLKAFDVKSHVTVSNLGHDHDRFWNEVTTLWIPKTKVTVEGQRLCWAKQHGPSDPEAALQNHLRVNAPQPVTRG